MITHTRFATLPRALRRACIVGVLGAASALALATCLVVAQTRAGLPLIAIFCALAALPNEALAAFPLRLQPTSRFALVALAFAMLYFAV